MLCVFVTSKFILRSFTTEELYQRVSTALRLRDTDTETGCRFVQVADSYTSNFQACTVFSRSIQKKLSTKQFT